jgi:dCTP deaminase
VILVDHQIDSLCLGIVPDDLRYFYFNMFNIPLPCKISPLVEPYDAELVNPASLDIRIGETARWKVSDGIICVDLREYVEAEPRWLNPGDLYLIASMETINLPSFLTAQFKLKSSRAREYYGHQFAGFCDPGWHGSKLTMELVNDSPDLLPIYPGLKMGQLIFSLALGRPSRSYAVTGRYNGDQTVMESKG